MAAGAVARKILGSEVRIVGYLVQVGADAIDRDRFDAWPRSSATRSGAPTPAPRRWEAQLNEVRKAGSSVGAVVEVVASGVPAGLGEPVYDKLDADLAKAMMSINAVKGVEIGAGFAAAACAARTTPTRSAWATTARASSPTTPAASWAGSAPARTSWCASRSSPPRRS